jgi:hypothetical protein
LHQLVEGIAGVIVVGVGVVVDDEQHGIEWGRDGAEGELVLVVVCLGADIACTRDPR